MSYRYIVSSHMNRYLSGVAKFNHLLAERLGAECVALHDAVPDGPALVSIKLSDCPDDALSTIAEACDRLQASGIVYDLFFHTFDDLPIERAFIGGSREVFAGNAELTARIVEAGSAAVTLWCPALVDSDATVESVGLTIFSFGMSHKIQMEYYVMLEAVLSDAGIEHELLVSTAFHEKASFGEIDLIEQRFRETFGERVKLLGFLSDGSVNHFLHRSDLFCAFFQDGVRANNTSVYAAMGSGTPLVTNLDQYSPQWMQHGVNVLDIRQLDATCLTGETLERIGREGRQAATEHASWEALVRVLAEGGADV